MNVYPENMLERIASFSSPQLSDNSEIADTYHCFLGLRAEFNGNSASITGNWGQYPVYIDSFIIGDTNADSFRLMLKNTSDVIVHDSATVYKSGNTFHIQDTPALLIKSFTLTVTAQDNLYIGYLFLGEKVDIGDFDVEPQHSLEVRGESGRTLNGQSYGLPQATLEGFSASFSRIENRTKKILWEYIKYVLNVQPHIIDPYPCAREEFEPMYVTLTAGVQPTKRDEAGFFWNFGSLEWEEAK
jgi:hypothetical protein